MKNMGDELKWDEIKGKQRLSSEEKALVKQLCTSNNSWVASRAIERLYKFVNKNDLTLVQDLFLRKRNIVHRVELIECLAKINGEQAIDQIKRCANAKTNTLVRYYAIRNLIELCPESVDLLLKEYRHLRSPFSKSLWVYGHWYWSDIDSSQAIGLINEGLAVAKSKLEGTNWQWLKKQIQESTEP